MNFPSKILISILPFPFQVLYNLLGESLTRLERHEEAERWFKAALSAKPDHVPAHLTYGKLLAKNVSTFFGGGFEFLLENIRLKAT